MKHFSNLVVSLVLVLLPFFSWSQTDYPSTGRMVVKYNPGVTEARKAQLREEWQGERLASLEEGTLEVWDLSRNHSLSGQTRKAVADKLAVYARQKSEILFTEPDYIFEAEALTNDPHYAKQWGLSNTGQNAGTAGADIRLPSQWDQQDDSTAIIAGIIDTGIDWGHEDLVDNIWQNLAEDFDGDGHTIEYINGAWELDPGDLNGTDDDGNGYVDDLVGWDFVNDDNNPFDDNGHGTHVAGIVGAKGNNGKGIAGVSWNTQMMALKAFDSHGAGSVLSIVPALAYARQMGAVMTNNSWGGPAYSQALYDEMALANDAGMLSIAAAGNNGSNNTELPMYPGSFDLNNLICVAASNRNDSLATFSNYSYQLVDVAAPGDEVYSTLPGNLYGYKSGTSMATPMVTGVLAYIWALDTNRNANQIRQMLYSTVDQVPGLAGHCATGGRVNLLKAVAKTNIFCDNFQINEDGKEVVGILTRGDTAWFGSNYGVYQSHMFRCQDDTVWDDDNGLPDKKVFSITGPVDGIIWVGTDLGLSKFDGTTWTTYDKDNSDLPGFRVEKVFAENADSVWLVVRTGESSDKYKYKVGTFDGVDWKEHKNLFKNYPKFPVNAFKRDSAGVMWIAHENGITRHDGPNNTHYYDLNSPLPSNKVTSIEVDSLGHLWFGTEGKGLVHFDGANWTIYDKDNSGLVYDKVWALEFDQTGNLWIGTNNGLNKYDGSSWILYDDSDPLVRLPDKEVRSLHTDADNNVWAGTKKGVMLFGSNTLMSAFTINNAPCLNVPVDFQNSSIGGLSFEWLVNGDSVSVSTNLAYTFSTPGTYSVSLVANNMFQSDTLVQQIKILPLPHVDLVGDTTACASVVVLDAGMEGMKYAWTNLTDTLLSTKKIFRADSSGTYALMLTSGCGAFVTDTITVTLSGDCVWPGDVNYDGKVNMIDYLSLGIAHGETGSARSGATSQWQSEPAANWPKSFHPGSPIGAGVNFKHADCNGDGIIDLNTDGAVIMQNAGFVHEAIEAGTSDPIYLRVEPTLTTMTATDTAIITYEVELATGSNDPVNGVYGFAFTLDYNLPLSVTPVIDIDGAYTSDFSAAVITYDESNNATGNQVNAYRRSMSIGAVARNGQNQTLSSRVATMSVIVVLEDVQENGVMDFTSLSITPGNLVVVDNKGAAKAVSNQSSSATSTVTIYIDNSMPFPIEWLDFTAEKVDDKVSLNWVTAQETGQESYTVQRSFDGIRFENLDLQSSPGRSDEPVFYEFLDEKPSPGSNFYRIQRREQDGSIINSEMISVRFVNSAMQMLVFPNPSTGPLSIQILAQQNERGRLRLLSSLGKVCWEEEVTLRTGEQAWSFDGSQLSPGIYYVELSLEDHRRVAKVVLGS
jgi:subtilisin family serine protease/PKD repeat protein